MSLSMESQKTGQKSFTWWQHSSFIFPSKKKFHHLAYWNLTSQFKRHKFASNVVEKSIAHGTDEQRSEIVKVITSLRLDGSSPLQVLMRDQYGNYVIRKLCWSVHLKYVLTHTTEKLLIQLKDKDRELLVDQIKPQLQALKKYHFGKQINAVCCLRFPKID